MEVALMDLVSAVGVLLGSLLLGGVKKYTGALDGKIGDVVKPLQPLLVATAGVVLPHVTGALGVTVDPTQLVTAPTATLAATVVTIGLREAAARVRKVTAGPQLAPTR